MKFHNSVCMHKDNSKPGPSGMSQNEAFSNYQSWGGDNFLMTIPDMSIIHELKVAMGGDELLMFTSIEFDTHAQMVFDLLHLSELTMENAWDVFTVMYRLLYPL